MGPRVLVVLRRELTRDNGRDLDELGRDGFSSGGGVMTGCGISLTASLTGGGVTTTSSDSTSFN